MSTPLTCAQVVALPVDAWCNDGFQGIVLKIEPINKKAGGVFYKVTIGDREGDYTSSVSLSEFTAPRYAVGDIIRITGKGIKRGDYQGKPQISRGKDSTVDVMPSSAKVQQAVTQHIADVKSNQAQAHAEGLINGQAVGNAMTNAFENMRHMYPDAKAFQTYVTSPAFWSEVWTLASDHLRIARLLESGKLVDPVSKRSAPALGSRQVPPPQPKHDPEAELNEGSEDVPY